MGAFRSWMIEQLPLLELFPKRTGNELRSKNGGTILITPFESKKGDDSKLSLPTPSSRSRKGLGDLGLDILRDTTFRSGEIPAGNQPVISRGIPMTGVEIHT